jgi:hypothetical protein
MGRHFAVVVVSAASMICCVSVYAQGRHPRPLAPLSPPTVRNNPPRLDPPVERPRQNEISDFLRMPEEQQRKRLAKLPPDKRAALEQRIANFNKLPAGQRELLLNRWERLNSLPPHRQKAIRQAANHLAKQPPDRQQAIRQELSHLGTLTDDQRQERISSPEFKKQFKKGEQEIVRDMSDLLPDEDL